MSGSKTVFFRQRGVWGRAVSGYGCFQSSLKACLQRARLWETEPEIESNIIKEFHPSCTSVTLISVTYLWQCNTAPLEWDIFLSLSRSACQEGCPSVCLCVCACQSPRACVPVYLHSVWSRMGGFMYVLRLLPCSYYKTIAVILLQVCVCVLFPHQNSFSSILHKGNAFNTETTSGCWTKCGIWSTTPGYLQWNAS